MPTNSGFGQYPQNTNVAYPTFSFGKSPGGTLNSQMPENADYPTFSIGKVGVDTTKNTQEFKWEWIGVADRLSQSMNTVRIRIKKLYRFEKL